MCCKKQASCCGCVPTDESRLISSCNEFLSELKRYECTEDIDYDVFIAMSAAENLLGLLKKKEKEQEQE